MNEGAEAARHLALLKLAPGGAGSGLVRYGAAMYFHQAGRISAGMLEIYRICCKLDAEDPVALARHHGVETPDFLGDS